MFEATFVGHLLEDPTEKTITVKATGELKRVLEVRVMYNSFRKENDVFVTNKDKSFPVALSIWNERPIELCLKHLKKGMRVRVQAEDLVPNPYFDKDNSVKVGINMNAKSIDVCLSPRIEIHKVELPDQMDDPAAEADHPQSSVDSIGDNGFGEAEHA